MEYDHLASQSSMLEDIAMSKNGCSVHCSSQGGSNRYVKTGYSFNKRGDLAADQWT